MPAELFRPDPNSEYMTGMAGFIPTVLAAQLLSASKI